MNEEKLVRMTLDEIRQAHERGDFGNTDWERVRALTDEDIEEAVRNDPDAAPLLDKDFWKDATTVRSNGKVDVRLELDADIVMFFQQNGDDYPSQIPVILRKYVDERLEKQAD